MTGNGGTSDRALLLFPATCICMSGDPPSGVDAAAGDRTPVQGIVTQHCGDVNSMLRGLSVRPFTH